MSKSHFVQIDSRIDIQMFFVVILHSVFTFRFGMVF